jgi:hypothetical protein
MADELDVLLEPQRERERFRERRAVRQKVVRRATFVTAIVLACLAGLFAYSKRETLRLASELNRARAEGAASFDKLDTCIASHQLAQRDAQTCRDARAKEQVEFKAALEQIAKTGGASETASSRQMQALEATFMARLRACEDDAETAKRFREAERESLAGDWRKRETDLVTSREESRRQAEARAAELERCRADLEAESRNAPARAAPAHSAGAVPAPGSSAGGSGSTPAPTGSAGGTTE